MAINDGKTDNEVLERTKLKEPELYKVVLHNDDYTTMEFVVEVIIEVFHKDTLSARRIMLDIHRKGSGSVGSYTYDVATTKAEQVHRRAREQEFPLRCSVEPA